MADVLGVSSARGGLVTCDRGHERADLFVPGVPYGVLHFRSPTEHCLVEVLDDPHFKEIVEVLGPTAGPEVTQAVFARALDVDSHGARFYGGFPPCPECGAPTQIFSVDESTSCPVPPVGSTLMWSAHSIYERRELIVMWDREERALERSKSARQDRRSSALYPDGPPR